MEDTLDTMALSAYEKGLVFACEILEDTPFLLKGDPGRLCQIIYNLVSNAIKFTGRGEVILRIEKEEESELHATIKFSVKDTGTGIESDKKDRLFKSSLRLTLHLQENTEAQASDLPYQKNSLK